MRKSKTPSVESVSTLCSSRYYSSSFLISSQISVLSILLSASVCVKQKRFLDHSKIDEGYFTGFFVDFFVDIFFRKCFFLVLFLLKKSLVEPCSFVVFLHLKFKNLAQSQRK